jgi:ribosomal protein L40E
MVNIKCMKCGADTPAEAKFCISCGANMADQKKDLSKAASAARAGQKSAEAVRITDEFKGKGGFWQKIIPGYHGYKQKEMRRESDKLLRDHLVKQLGNTKKELSSIQEDAAESAPGILTKLEDMLTELDTFLRNIQHAGYGFGGLYDAVKVKETELDKLLDFDRNVVETVINIDGAVKQLKDDLAEGAAEKVKAVRDLIKNAIKIYGQRTEYIKGWTPSA